MVHGSHAVGREPVKFFLEGRIRRLGISPPRQVRVALRREQPDLDARGQVGLLVCGQKRHPADLLQVRAHGVGGTRGTALDDGHAGTLGVSLGHGLVCDAECAVPGNPAPVQEPPPGADAAPLTRATSNGEFRAKPRPGMMSARADVSGGRHYV